MMQDPGCGVPGLEVEVAAEPVFVAKGPGRIGLALKQTDVGR